MASEMGPVKVSVTLDTQKAKEQLDQLKKDLDQRDKKAKAIGGELKKLGGGTSPGAQKVEQGIAEKLVQRATQRALASNPVAQLALGSQAQGILQKIGGSTLAQGVAGGAALYAGASVTAKAAPTILEFLKGLSPDEFNSLPGVKELTDQLNSFRTLFTTFESKVISYFKAMAETTKIATAGARLSGKLVSIPFYADLEQSSAEAFRDLDKKFDAFKRDEVAGGLGESLRDGLRRAFVR